MADKAGSTRKGFAVFDCDAHVNDPVQIWEYVPKASWELVKETYWRDETQAWVNGTDRVFGGGSSDGRVFSGMYNPICIAGPQMNKKILRRLMLMSPLTTEQRKYLEHQGAYNPHARIKEMDLMGIDQVLVIPTEMIANLPFAENADGCDVLCRAYNDWCRDWCAEVPGRLYPAALLPLQSPEYAAKEVYRAARMGFPVGLIRPIDARGAYPNDIGAAPGSVASSQVMTRFGAPVNMDAVFRAFEETGMVLGMHTFPAHPPGRTAGPGLVATPGELVNMAGADSQTLSFIYEMQIWLAQVLLSGFLDRYPAIKMAVFESNSQWVPAFLETCDRQFDLYQNERRTPAKRRPSEAFYEQCVVSFESDETPTMRQWEKFENIGIWASDAYHHDGADSWSAIREMNEIGVPDSVQAKLLGDNARRMYGIDPKLVVTEEPPPIARPDWFPQGDDFEEWAKLVAYPRQNADRLRELRPASGGPVLTNAAY